MNCKKCNKSINLNSLNGMISMINKSKWTPEEDILLASVADQDIDYLTTLFKDKNARAIQRRINFLKSFCKVNGRIVVCCPNCGAKLFDSVKELKKVTAVLRGRTGGLKKQQRLRERNVANV